ncbi:MAG TPA: class I SAM-dependent methyltransferase, partial [Thermomicrobiales bacterium]|nr:class I SAM-dependent methyltransferase [Thermomicrobiales bacterium]
MQSPEMPDPWWSEADSQHFIELGRIYTPDRDEIRDTILDLLPARADEAFLAVELAVGAGWLSEAILARFPRARVLGLDGSPAMLRETAVRLRPYADRVELRPFRLEDPSWLADLPEAPRCVVSSLVLHHLDADGKRALYRALHDRLAPGGALLVADLVAPRSEWQRRYLARQWDAAVERQSLAFTGNLDAYHRFVAEHWNWYEYPDPVDMPSAVPEHLAWLAEAGFAGADVFWARAGHAVYGAYKVSRESGVGS